MGRLGWRVGEDVWGCSAGGGLKPVVALPRLLSCRLQFVSWRGCVHNMSFKLMSHGGIGCVHNSSFKLMSHGMGACTTCHSN